MIEKFKLTRTSALVLAVSCTVTGAGFMSVLDIKTAGTAASEAETASEQYSSPSAGMSVVLSEFCDFSNGLAVEYLATTAVAASGSVNEYVTSAGDIEGKYIVCSAEDYAYVYSSADDSGEPVAKIYTNGVATLLDLDWEWCRIITGGIEGYVKTSEFLFGEVAQEADADTYITTAFINTDELYMYSDESTDSTVLCVLAYGYEFEVVEADDGSGYTKLSVDGVGEGYVSTEGILTATSHNFGISIEDEEATALAVSYGIEQAEAIEEEKAEEAARIAAEEEAARIAAEEAAAEAEAAAKAEAEAAAKAAAQAAAVKEAQANADALAGSGEAAEIRQAIADYACTFVGWLPYVSGGHSLTTGADCSGFTAAIYAHFGYSLSYSSSAQASQGRSVSLSEITVGDLVIYSGHVAIYIGNGQIVHEPTAGQCVKISSINIMTVLDVRRIVE